MTEREPLPSFKDQEAHHERFGFDSFLRGGVGLPGSTWAEGNMFNGRFFVPNCNNDEAIFTDTVWGMGRHESLNLHDNYEERIFLNLFYSDAIRRLQAVEQLTLPPKYSTVTNTGAFSRFEHIWGSVLFVRQMAKKHNIDTTESVRLQLRTLLSDVGQRLGSHLGDWAFQGIGGPENQHDLDLFEYLEVNGINDIIRAYNIDPADVIFPEVIDWVEAPSESKHICVDRVDFGLREMNRTNDVIYMHGFSSEDFVITPENMLAMTNLRRARVFAEGYLLLSEENWSEATHQFILEMLLLRTKLFYAEGHAPDTWVFKTVNEKIGLIPLHEIHPKDLMYVTDPAQALAYAQPNLSGHMLDAIMRNISQYHRQFVWPGRREQINNYMNQFASDENYERVLSSGQFKPYDSPEFKSYLSEYPQTTPNGFAILTTAEAEATKSPMDFDFNLKPFKLRQIDPLVQSDDDFKRLSELDPSFKVRLAEHQAKIERPRVARLSIPDPYTNKLMGQILDNVEVNWQRRLLESRRMTPDELKSLVQVSANYETHGEYPFMSYLEF